MQCWGRIPIPFNTSRVGVSDVDLSVFVKKSWSAGCGYGFYKKIREREREREMLTELLKA